MDITKIFVTVDNHAYQGLYWLTEARGKKFLSVSYGGLKKISKQIALDNEMPDDQIAKTMLYDLIKNME